MQKDKYRLQLSSSILAAVKIYKAMPNAPGMNQSEIDTLLGGSKTPLRLGTANAKGEPNIHPVWYHYTTNKFYFMSYKDAVKVRNVKSNKTVYSSVDTDAMPSTGVKGEGTAIMSKTLEKHC